MRGIVKKKQRNESIDKDVQLKRFMTSQVGKWKMLLPREVCPIRGNAHGTKYYKKEKKRIKKNLIRMRTILGAMK